MEGAWSPHGLYMHMVANGYGPQMRVTLCCSVFYDSSSFSVPFPFPFPVWVEIDKLTHWQIALNCRRCRCLVVWFFIHAHPGPNTSQMHTRISMVCIWGDICIFIVAPEYLWHCATTGWMHLPRPRCVCVISIFQNLKKKQKLLSLHLDKEFMCI